MSNDLLTVPIDRIDGSHTNLAEHAGKVLLIVNVASKCGLTPQYEGLESLYRTYRGQGLVVLGFPANNFGGQEPGTNDEVADFCRSTYGVDFPMYAKISVKGGDQHPLYRRLIAEQPDIEFLPGSSMQERRRARGVPDDDHDVAWNFEKFLLSRKGEVLRRFAPDTRPEDPVIVEAIVGALRE